MVLAKQPQEILLNGGLDQKQSADVQDPSTLTEALNLRFNELHQLEKRAWYTQHQALYAGTSYADSGNIETVFNHRGYPCGLTENEGVGYVSSNTVADVVSTTGNFADSGAVAGRSRACRVSREIIGATQFGLGSIGLLATTCSVIETPETTVVAWLEITAATTMTLHAVAIDAGGSRVAKTSVSGLSYTYSLSNSPSIQSCVTGNSVPEVLITYAVDAGGSFSVYGVVYDSNTVTFSSPTALATSLLYPNHHVLGGPTSLASVYLAVVDSGTTFLKVYTLSGALAVAATHVATHGAGVGVSMARSASTGHVLISSCSSATVWAERLGTPASVTTVYVAAGAETLIGVAAGNQTILSDTDRFMLMVGIRNSTAAVLSVLTRTYDYSYATNATIASSLEPNVLPLTHGVTLGTRCYFAMHLGIGRLESALTSAMVVRADREKLARVARICHDRMVGAPSFTSLPIYSFGSIGTSRITGAFPGDVSPISGFTGGSGLGQIVLLPTVTLADAGEAFPLVSVEHDGTTLLASGDLGDWDGKALNEAQPIHRPRCSTVAVAAGAITGTLTVAAVWRFIDQAGKLHRSAPSEVATKTLAAESLDVYVTRPPLTSMSGTGAMQIHDVELYVSALGGSVLYLSTVVGGAKRMPDLTTYPHMAYFTGVAAGITTSPVIYTSGAGGQELKSEPPPSFISIAKISDVMWGIDAEDRRRIWHSKPLVAGYAVEWNAVNTLFIADEAVGISDVNGTPTIFTKGGIWVVEGAGPNANGVGGFSPARRLPVEVSAICPTSICKTPGGTFFRSPRGISMLDNGFQLSAVGLPIDSMMPITNERTASVRVMYDERHNEVRVIDRDNGVFLYNVVEGKWTEYAQSTLQNIADACVSGGRVWYAGKTETVWELRREFGVDEDDYSSSLEPWQLTTPWLRFDGVAGFGRLWRMYSTLRQAPDADFYTAALSAVLELDNDDTTQSFSWSSVSDLSASDDTYTVAMHPKKQSLKRFRVTLAEISNVTHAGSKPVALRLEMGVRPGSKQRVPDAARKG